MVSGLDVPGERERSWVSTPIRACTAQERVMVGDGAAAALRPRVGGLCGVRDGSQGVAPLSKCAQWPLRSGQCLPAVLSAFICCCDCARLRDRA